MDATAQFTIHFLCGYRAGTHKLLNHTEATAQDAGAPPPMQCRSSTKGLDNGPDPRAHSATQTVLLLPPLATEVLVRGVRVNACLEEHGMVMDAVRF